MDYKKPQSTLVQGNTGIYPLTTADQVILADGSRLEKDGRISADSAANSAKLGGKAPEYYIQPRNLLDNSDFTNPVNQRGATSYSGYDYKIDRWRSFFPDCKLDVNDGYIEISGNSAVQITVAKNGTYSAFAMNTDGNIVEISTEYSTEGTSVKTYLPAGKWKWAALYEGSYTAETLPPYVPKGYSAELAECQRYYRRGLQAVTIGKTYGNGAIFSLYFPKMRIYPTINILGISSQGWGNVDKNNYARGWGDDYGSEHYVNFTSSITEDVGKTVVVEYEYSADL